MAIEPGGFDLAVCKRKEGEFPAEGTVCLFFCEVRLRDHHREGGGRRNSNTFAGEGVERCCRMEIIGRATLRQWRKEKDRYLS